MLVQNSAQWDGSKLSTVLFLFVLLPGLWHKHSSLAEKQLAVNRLYISNSKHIRADALGIASNLNNIVAGLYLASSPQAFIFCGWGGEGGGPAKYKGTTATVTTSWDTTT